MAAVRPWLLLLCTVALLAGCATRLPPATPMTGQDDLQARELLNRFLALSCPAALDADITVDWHGYGRHQAIAATIQAREPSFLRFAINDSLGRSLILLVTDGLTFTMADVRKEKGTTGTVASRFWQEYVPAGVHPRDFFSWLTGRVPSEGIRVAEVLRSQENSDYWFVLDYGDGLRHRIRLDADTLVLRDHLLLDPQGKVVLDVVYDCYPSGKGNCPLPGSFKVTGDDLAGTFSLHVDRVYSRQPLPAATFQLHLPPHFTVRHVR